MGLMARSRASLEDDPAQVMTLNVIGIFLRLVLWSMVMLLALENLGVDVTALIAGIGGVAVALTAQNILGDLFASVSIALDKPFVLGDYVTVGGGHPGDRGAPGWIRCPDQPLAPGQLRRLGHKFPPCTTYSARATSYTWTSNRTSTS